eukprot:9684638-Alexandrium_andersonii.AAC.1
MREDAGAALAAARAALAEKAVAASSAVRGPFPALFPDPTPTLCSALRCLARAGEEGAAAAVWRACQAWDSA